jgi:hypothetical protein
VLFVPIGYRFNCEYKDELSYSGKVVWLFGLVGVRFSQDGGAEIIAPKLISRIFNSEDTSTDIDEADDYEEKYEADEFTDYGDYDDYADIESSTVNTERVEDNSSSDDLQELVTESDGSDKAELDLESDDYSTETDSDKSDLQEDEYNSRKSFDLSAIQSFCNGVKDKLKAIKVKVLYLRRNIDKYKHFDRQFNVKLLVKRSFLLTKKLFSALGLKLFRFYGIIGLDNPADTGLVIAAVSAFKPVLPEGVKIEGDFDNQVVELDCEASGNVFLIRLVAATIWFILDKRVLGAIKYFLRGDEGERVKQQH